jgi:hypothetical protein
MSTSERDMQFAEWAGLLFDELMEIDDVDDVKKCISRRVHDLAQFIVSQAYADDLKPQEILYKNGKPVLMYPENLKEWYEGKKS